MSQAPFVQPRLGDGHFMDSSQKAYNMWTYMIISYMIISSGIQNTEEYNNKPLMSLILGFMTD